MNKLINPLKELIIEAGKIALAIKDKGVIIDYKQDNSPVTNADQAISQFIYDGLQNIAPDIVVICEERIKQKVDANFWLIDPVDGTNSYIRGENTYTVNIALIIDNKPALGLIYQPETAKLYYADVKSSLHLEQNGQIIPISNIKIRKKYLALIGSQNLDHKISAFLEKYGIKDVLSLSSSIKLCMIAEGYADIYPKFTPTMEWDIAAGHALIIASGGDITDSRGKQLTYGKYNFQNSDFFAYGKYWQNHI